MPSQEMIRSRSRSFAKMYVLLALAAAMPFEVPAMGPDQPTQVVDKLVDVGGYNLNFRVIPGTDPTIVLESGGGMTSALSAAALACATDALRPQPVRATGLTGPIVVVGVLDKPV